LIASGVFLVTGLFMDFMVRMPFIGGKFIPEEYWSGMGYPSYFNWILF